MLPTVELQTSSCFFIRVGEHVCYRLLKRHITAILPALDRASTVRARVPSVRNYYDIDPVDSDVQNTHIWSRNFMKLRLPSVGNFQNVDRRTSIPNYFFDRKLHFTEESFFRKLGCRGYPPVRPRTALNLLRGAGNLKTSIQGRWTLARANWETMETISQVSQCKTLTEDWDCGPKITGAQAG